MKNSELPLWQRLHSPTTSHAELTELRHTLATQPLLSQQLQAFFYAEYLTTHAYARVELNDHLRQEYLHYANALAELSGKLFAEPKNQQTTKMPPV